MNTPQSANVTLARVLRPHGRRGEVACEILTDFPERLRKLKFVELSGAHHALRRVAVRGCWLSQSRGGQAIFHFEGCDTIDDAKKLTGLEIQIPLAERLPLPPRSYYTTDLIGCEVRERNGEKVGRVREVQFTGEDVPGTPNLVIDTPRGELLIPLAADICVDVNISARAIEVVLPEGLRELNDE
ncbi:MAG: ribosome maturation factor RimM [Candidatus Acidiferrales bacterium]